MISSAELLKGEGLTVRARTLWEEESEWQLVSVHVILVARAV